jgi:FkbM family methyltransferase
MGEKWYDSDWPELPEISLLKSHGLKPGATVFDIGAHQCVVAMMLAHPVGENGTVLAVEALPRNAELGRRNCELNGYSSVHVVNAAVGERSGRIEFSTDQHVSAGRSSASTTVWVDSHSIDDLSERFGWPDVLFIDIEGYEIRALLGATKTLERNPDCFVEVHVGCGLEEFGGSVESLVRFFPTDRFALYLRAEADKQFDSFQLSDQRTTRRFFLIAVARRD